MRNLLERIKAEPLAKLNEGKKEYPKTFQDVEIDFKNNYFILDLKYDTILKLHYFNIISDVKISTVQNLFND